MFHNIARKYNRIKKYYGLFFNSYKILIIGKVLWYQSNNSINTHCLGKRIAVLSLCQQINHNCTQISVSINYRFGEISLEQSRNILLMNLCGSKQMRKCCRTTNNAVIWTGELSFPIIMSIHCNIYTYICITSHQHMHSKQDRKLNLLSASCLSLSNSTVLISVLLCTLPQSLFSCGWSEVIVDELCLDDTFPPFFYCNFLKT